MVFKRKHVKLKAVKHINFTVFLGSLLITMVQAQTMDPLNVTQITTEITNTPDVVHASISSSSPLTRITSSNGDSSRAASTASRFQSTRNLATPMPSSSNLQSTQSPSSISAMTSTIPILATTTSVTESPTDHGITFIPEEKTTIVQTYSERTTVAETEMPSTEAVITSEKRTTHDSQMTSLIEQSPSPELQTKTPTAMSHDRTTITATPSESVYIVTTNARTSPADDPTTSNTVSVKLKSTEEPSSTKAGTKTRIKTTKASLPLKTTRDAQPTEVSGSPSSGSATKPLLSIPQWFAVFLGTFLTIFLIFLTNIWYKAKMTPDNSKPSIELVKNSNKNDRPKSWQDTNVPLDFMSLHIELPKETKVEMTCAENPAFEGDQPDNPSSLPNSSFEVVTLTKL